MRTISLARVAAIAIGWLACGGALAAESPRPAARPATALELSNLFSRVARPAPSKFHFRADIEVVSPAWTEQRILEELREQETVMREYDRQLAAGAKKEIRALRLQGIQKAHSGSSRHEVEMWVSGDLYRKDEVWTSIPKPSHWSYVHIGDPAFTNITGFMANETLQSVTLYTNNMHAVPVDPLWEGYTIEPMFAMPLVIAMASTNGLAGGDTRGSPSPFAGFGLTLDPDKAQRMADGSHEVFTLEVTPAEIAGAPVLCYRFKSKGPEEAGELHARYWLDASDSDRLYRVEIQFPGQPILTSTRSGFDADGWPLRWSSESLDAEGHVVTKHVSYHSLEHSGDFDDWQTFAPVFPDRYAVSVSSGDGVGEVIRNPRGSTMSRRLHTSDSSNLLSKVFPVLLCIVLVALPAAFMRRTPKPQPANGEERP